MKSATEPTWGEVARTIILRTIWLLCGLAILVTAIDFLLRAATADSSPQLAAVATNRTCAAVLAYTLARSVEKSIRA